jgi:hypothetical protein
MLLGKKSLLTVSTRAVFGGPRRFVTQWRGRPLGETIQTAFLERWYGTLRELVAPWRRRTHCLSWDLTRHRRRIWLLVSLYNFVIPHKSFRQGYIPRTPAMAIGLTDHVWNYREYIWPPIHRDPVLSKQMDERIVRLLTPALQDYLDTSTRVKTSPAEGARAKTASVPKAA